MGITTGKAFKNATWIVACKIIQSLIGLVISSISARYLGPSNYGLISYASSLIAFVTPLAQLGLRNILVDKLLSQPEREGKILGTSLVMSMVAGLFCVLGCVCFVAIANAGEKETLIVCALYGISLIFQMSEATEYWYQAKLYSKYTSVVSLSAYVIVALYKIFLLVTQKNIYWFAVSNGLDYLIIASALLILYRKLGGKKLSFSFSVAKELFSVSRYYIISGMMVTLFSQTDKIMLKMMIGNTENGYYSTAITITGMTGFVFVAIIDSLRPMILESKRENEAAFQKNVSRLYSVIIYMGLMQSVAFTVLAKPLVLILYGEEYAPAISILRIITWYTAFSYMGSVRNIWILAEGKQKCLWLINLLGATLNVAGNFALIPLLGAEGAAIASVATQFFTNFILCIILKPIRPTAKLIYKSLNPKLWIEMIPKRKKKDE